MGKKCIWVNIGGYFETSCKDAFEFVDGGIKDNHFNFCPYCGKEIDERV